MPIRCKSYSNINPNLALRISDGRIKKINVTTKSKFYQLWNMGQITHLALPNKLAIEILSESESFIRRPANRHNCEVEYVTFTLGKVVRRCSQDVYYRTRKKIVQVKPEGLQDCVALTTKCFLDCVIEKGKRYHYKISKYDTKRGKRYLLFCYNAFYAGFDEDEFESYFNKCEDKNAEEKEENTEGKNRNCNSEAKAQREN
jgi:hypothetical protein